MRTEEEYKRVEAERDLLREESRKQWSLATDWAGKCQLLAARVLEMQVSFLKILGLENTEADEWDGVERVIPEMCAIASSALATPDTNAQVLARLKAAIWMEACEMCEQMWADNIGRDCESGYSRMTESLRAKADELLNGSEKEHEMIAAAGVAP